MKDTVYSIRIKIFTIAAAVVIAGSLISGCVRLARLEKQREINAQRALTGFAENMEQVDIELEKCLCAGTRERFAQEAALLWSNTQQAKLMLGEIAMDTEDTEKIERFLSQTGEYALSIADGGITDEQRDKLIELSGCAKKLNAASQEILFRILDKKETYSTYDISDEFSSGKLPEEYPEMIYEGNFSDEKNDNDENEKSFHNDVGIEAAAKAAKRFFKADKVRYEGTQEGKQRAYLFTSKGREAAVSCENGRVLEMMSPRRIKKSYITFDEAIIQAKKFLKENGYLNMRLTEIGEYGNKCSMKFAYVEQEEIIIYPDEIKLSVALDSGEITAFDAYEYAANHKEKRRLAAAKTRAQAQDVLCGLLSVCDCRMAVIATQGGKEELCYEFLCETWDGGQATVFVNSQTLSEEKILLKD